MLKVGVPEGAVRAKCLQAGLDPEALFRNGGKPDTSPPKALERQRAETTVADVKKTASSPGRSTTVNRVERASSMPTISNAPSNSSARRGMLDGIKNFSKGALKKTKTVDKSKPIKGPKDGAANGSSGGGGSLADMLKKQFASRGMS